MRVSKLISGGALAALALAVAAPAVAQDRGGRGDRGARDRDVDVSVRIDTSPRAWSYGQAYAGAGHHAHRAPYAQGKHYRGARYARPVVLAPGQVRHSLRSFGFSGIHAIEYRPRQHAYTAYATGRRGNLVFVKVDAYTGQVLHRERVGRHGAGAVRRGHGSAVHW